MNIEAEASLGERNTLAAPSTAAWYARAEDEGQLREALDFARRRALPVVIMGEGSNIVPPPRIEALALRPALKGVEVLADDGREVLLRVGAGENWSALVARCCDSGWHGLENLSGIPGSAGAAPVQNIGAYGVELRRRLEAVEVMEVGGDGACALLPPAACGFGYRRSRFRGEWRDRRVILALRLRLSRKAEVNCDYPRLAEALAAAGCERPRPEDVRREVLALRRRLPDPARAPNVGSFFKNPTLDEAAAAEFRRRHPTLPLWPVDGGARLAAAAMLDELGWRGRRVADVKVHDEHALVIVNDKGCEQSRILACAETMRAEVRERFGMELEYEPRVDFDGAAA